MLDQITVTLRDKSNYKKYIYIDVLENSLSQKWLTSLNHLLKHDFHLEKNYHWMGFAERDLELLCDKINYSLQEINNNTTYDIHDSFTLDNTITKGEVGYELPGARVVHEKFNILHRYFEDLQGQAENISPYYKNASPEIRWHIRQLNLLCHEFESRALSYRKEIHAPEWAQYNQLFCFLNTPTFNLDPETDWQGFGLDTLIRRQGDVFMGINKSVGKSHWEVFNDEGDIRLDELTTSALISQWQGSGDFDIAWSQDEDTFDWKQKSINEFVDWLRKNGFDPEDPSLTLGHPRVAKVNLLKSFGTTDYKTIQDILKSHLDVFRISTSTAVSTLDYRWDDADYNQLQIKLL
tara:strand:- start:865 stop:1914 length:1050 start_codon:yes stop_codon:yes gene_type:complete